MTDNPNPQERCLGTGSPAPQAAGCVLAQLQARPGRGFQHGNTPPQSARPGHHHPDSLRRDKGQLVGRVPQPPSRQKGSMEEAQTSVGIEGGLGALTSEGESRRLKGPADKGGDRGEARGLELVTEPPGAPRAGQHAGGTATEQGKRVFVQNQVRAQHVEVLQDWLLSPGCPWAIPFRTAHSTWPRHGRTRQGTLGCHLHPPRG